MTDSSGDDVRRSALGLVGLLEEAEVRARLLHRQVVGMWLDVPAQHGAGPALVTDLGQPLSSRAALACEALRCLSAVETALLEGAMGLADAVGAYPGGEPDPGSTTTRAAG